MERTGTQTDGQTGPQTDGEDWNPYICRGLAPRQIERTGTQGMESRTPGQMKREKRP